MAYRLERNPDDRKVLNDKGKLQLSEAVESEGISISFRSDEHAEYFLLKHKTGIMVVMEISERAYGEIQNKLSNGNAKVGGKKLTRPSPCSDSVMSKLSIRSSDVLTFSGDWKDYLESNMQVCSIQTYEK
ncbi:MAG: hypothetical protein Q8Q09_25935 [Deltaproteobacteria bacterium]|nr:hypothetical protein [Deltaproteobacteria bacterium]